MCKYAELKTKSQLKTFTLRIRLIKLADSLIFYSFQWSHISSSYFSANHGKYESAYLCYREFVNFDERDLSVLIKMIHCS